MKFRPRFTIRALLVIMALAAAGFWWWGSTHPHGLRRTWKGLQRINGYSFRFDGTQLHISKGNGTVSTPYSTSSIKDTLTIDFNGAYGLQRGIYRINEQRGELIMIVADPGVKRPVDIGAVDVIGKKGRTSNFVRYVLQKAD